MKLLGWADAKDELLSERGVSCEEVAVASEQGRLLDIITHPNHVRYPNQRIFVVRVLDYVYLAPFVEEPDSYFLKTIIPSRKATRIYLGVDDAAHQRGAGDRRII